MRVGSVKRILILRSVWKFEINTRKYFMNKLRSVTVLCAVLSFGIMGAASATCTKAVRPYARIFSGAYYDGTGALVQYFASDVTMTFSATGSGTEVEYGKQLTS